MLEVVASLDDHVVCGAIVGAVGSGGFHFLVTPTPTPGAPLNALRIYIRRLEGQDVR